ncbi:MAG: cupin domain-containing protein [Bacillota bacterium]
MNNQYIIITNMNEITPTHKCEHEPFEYYKHEVIKRSKENQCYVAIYEIPPQKSNYPYHYHLQNEEVFYIISGSGVLETPDGNKPISAGDIIYCPPNEKGAHRVINTSQTTPLVYLDFDTINNPDVVFYPKSDKVGLIVQCESSTFYKRDSNVDYYEGE